MQSFLRCVAVVNTKVCVADQSKRNILHSKERHTLSCCARTLITSPQNAIEAIGDLTVRQCGCAKNHWQFLPLSKGLMMFRSTFSTLACCCALTLTACGGGGSSNAGATPPVATTQTFDLKTTYANYLQTTVSRAFTVTGTTSGVAVSGSGNTTLGALQASTFQGAPALVRTQTLTASLTANGQTIPFGTSGQTYYDSNFNVLGAIGVNFSVVASQTSLPTAAKINDAGVWMTMTNYPSSNKEYVKGTTTTSYSLGAESESTAILTLIASEKSASGQTLSSTVETFRITTGNSVTALTESTQSAEGNLSLTYK